MWNPVTQSLDIKILQQILWTLALLHSRKQLMAQLLFLVFGGVNFTAILSSLTGLMKCFPCGRSSFLHFFFVGCKPEAFSILSCSVQSETTESARHSRHTSGLPHNCHDTVMMQMCCQDTSIVDHAYWQAFIDEYTQQYSITPWATPSGLLNTASCICDKALVGMVWL